MLPYAKSANEGLFCVKDFCRNGHTGSYTLVTPKGKLHFAELRSLMSRLSTQDHPLHNR